jgi:hypothetical protein
MRPLIISTVLVFGLAGAPVVRARTRRIALTARLPRRKEREENGMRPPDQRTADRRRGAFGFFLYMIRPDGTGRAEVSPRDGGVPDWIVE